MVKKSKTSNIFKNNPVLQNLNRSKSNNHIFFTEAYKIPQQPNEQFVNKIDPEKSMPKNQFTFGNFKYNEEQSIREVFGI
ncbi:unnamed protein product [Paramecium sonneborni]|uniref:Uncharacterized protein n=1 Tax=Paramecium sonneborni TaxID=65129 RepID=A0A8S1N4F9_9CILI|nr:unnamed protein product [Paramecium sonneborni]